LQCRFHEVWARFFSSSLKDDLSYTPSDCFETFPFPAWFETNAALEAAGLEYYEFRAALMQDLWLGLTEIYNHFHSPDDEALARLEALYRKRAATHDWRTTETVPADRSPLTLYATPAAALAGVRRLRELHAAMDTAVLTAYGWTDLLPKCTCEFLLDYEDEESESAEESGGRKKKKPWRYRWPDEVRDEVLARLLKENAKRAEQERTLPRRLAETVQCALPQRGDTGDILGHRFAAVFGRMLLAHIHRTGLPQPTETGMHFARHRAGQRTRLAVFGPDGLVGETFGQFIHDRQRFPHSNLAVDQNGNLAGR
jgi:hypothetical protein